jgi:transcriptional regulator with XRE-family HTH domain
MAETPIATWLREARKAQRRERDGAPWSQEDFLEALRADTGWHLHRPNYTSYETGRSTPSPATLHKLVQFWRGRGVEAPDFDAVVEPPLVGDALVAAAIDRQTAAIEAQTRMLGLVLSRLAQSGDLPELDELAAQRTYDALQRPRSVPDADPVGQ